jgi:hypothetical protein
LLEHPSNVPGEGETTCSSRKSKQPLWHRMYFQRHLTDIIRAFGYESVPIEEARERVKPLVETYGRPLIEAGTEELIVVDNSQSPVVARLSDEARKLAVQILGRPPQPRSEQTPSSTVDRLTETTCPPEATPPGTRTRRSRSKDSHAAETPSQPREASSGTSASKPRRGTKRKDTKAQ